MNISAKSDYACRAVIELALQYHQASPLTTSQIAEAHEIPNQFLVQILLQLKGAGLVQSSRGSAGGYRLMRPPEEITLWDVLQVVEGSAVEPPGGDSPALASCGILRCKWDEVAEVQQTILRSVTFAELAEEVRQRAEPMYYI